MKKPAIHSLKLSFAALMLGAFGFASTALAGPAPQPGGSYSFGKGLDDWQNIYWRWYFGGLQVPADSNGNAVVGNVVLMPLPNAPGDGTPGHLDVTLNSGQAFFLPLWNLVGNSYTDGTPNDPHVPVSVIQTLNLSFKIDGVTVMGPSNLMQFYVAFDFDPIIQLPPAFAPYAGVIWLEGIGLTHTPFSVGTHTLQLDAVNTQPAFGYTFEYHNTWTVTVKPAP